MKNKKGWLCLLALLLTIALIALFVPQTAVSSKETDTDSTLASTTATKSTSTPVKANKSSSVIQDLPQVLLDISWCESRDSQEKIGLNYRTRIVTLSDGSTTTEKYVWSRDIGRFQINEYYHAEEAKRLGFDIYTEEGNAAYALRLYNLNGTRDWNPSKACWSDITSWRAKEKSYY